jgi:hypothetical protein
MSVVYNFVAKVKEKIMANELKISNYYDRQMAQSMDYRSYMRQRATVSVITNKMQESTDREVAAIEQMQTGIQTSINAQTYTLVASQLAQELRTKVLTRTGVASDSEIDDSEYAAVRKAALEVKVTLAGFRQVTDFWQQQEVTGADGRKQVRYAAYIVYACPPDVWDKLVATYLMDIVGQLPDKKTQQAVAEMFEEFKADTRREEEKTEAQWRAELEAQKQAVENQQRLAMAQTPGGIVEAKAAGAVAQTQAIEDGRTLRTAIRSGNPVAIAAATIGAGDYDAVAALAAAAGL